MTNTGTFTCRRLKVLFASAAILFVVIFPRLASAALATGPLTHTEYFYNVTLLPDGGTSGQPQLLLQLNGNSSVNYYAQQISPGCTVPNVDIDTIKIWISLAQAAELSGKGTQIYYTTCNGLNYISDVVIYN